ncbi:futalosine hydrolase [Stieleria mannarensis]|uniref:futalosine hydrolase n=1 Tax=Stieleria mannarensis TaxID=2755585 RepID=UPI0015FED11A|nr:futalosine hydrolase [Rhodopirellula sp. JC639]
MNGLILVPTDAERRLIEPSLRIDADRWSIQTIGFGVIAAGIETTRLLLSERPDEVILAGIAGLFAGPDPPSVPSQPSLRIGDAIWFDSVAIDGIGIGRGDGFVDAQHLGWDWSAEVAPTGVIELAAAPDDRQDDPQPARLLTVCAGSANGDDAEHRRCRFPDAVGEDMEAFAVAYACHRAGVPLRVLRGFSNHVGVRDKSQWKIAASLASVASQLQHFIDSAKQ